ncbi:MAG: 50S ribosomal protein L29 [Nanoarchaeota archaeon]|nr:50S ribosomal protein L29 [Nanoarchaeota archaeon]MBU1855126.1 50S ribosomal protein L29 [Nanoarchaeota archaeon]
MKFKELSNLNNEELNKKLEEVKIELIKLNSQVATGITIKSPGQIKQLKKTIAKIKTIQKQNE